MKITLLNFTCRRVNARTVSLLIKNVSSPLGRLIVKNQFHVLIIILVNRLVLPSACSWCEQNMWLVEVRVYCHRERILTF